MIVTYAEDPRVTTAKKLTTATNVVLVDSDTKEVKTLESLSVACDGTGTDFSLYFRDGGVDYPIINAKPITAHDTVYVLEHHVKIRGGQQLRVEASAADHLTVIAVTIDGVPKRDNQPHSHGK